VSTVKFVFRFCKFKKFFYGLPMFEKDEFRFLMQNLGVEITKEEIEEMIAGKLKICLYFTEEYLKKHKKLKKILRGRYRS
jgi:hypothetical protein